MDFCVVVVSDGDAVVCDVEPFSGWDDVPSDLLAHPDLSA